MTEPFPPLTPTEQWLIDAIQQGCKTIAEIARFMEKSPDTVRTHIEHISWKLPSGGDGPLQTVLAFARGPESDPPERPERKPLNGAEVKCEIPPLGDRETYLYAIRRSDTEEIKIGVSKDPMRRLCDLQAGSGEPLELVAAIPAQADDEARVHLRFAHLRKLGEWFRPAPDLMEWCSEPTIPDDPSATWTPPPGTRRRLRRTEAHIAELVGAGLTYRQIAAELGRREGREYSPEHVRNVVVRIAVLLPNPRRIPLRELVREWASGGEYQRSDAA